MNIFTKFVFTMRMFFTAIFLLLLTIPDAKSQEQVKNTSDKLNTVNVENNNNDTMVIVGIEEIIIFPPIVFKDEKQKQAYNKLVRDVKKTLPYAKLIYATLIETYEYIETLPDDKSREAHLKRMEKELFEEYKPILKKMTLSQGKLLIKLIDRECNQTSYDLVKAFLGPFRAGFWNLFAGMFGASLKSEWDPEGKDATINRVVILVEKGLI